jgi:hypothetical protein
MQVSASTSKSTVRQRHYYIMAEPALPDDILHLLCEELANQEQFDTLFNCASASRALAIPALTHLYRYVTCVTRSQTCDCAYLQDAVSLTFFSGLIIKRLYVAVVMICTVCRLPPSF